MPTFQEILAQKKAESDARDTREAVTAYLQLLKSSDLTLGKVVAELQAANAWEQAKDIAITDILGLFQAPPTAKRSGRQRLSGPEKATLVDRIVAHVKANPWSGSRQIATGINAPSLQVSRLLKELVGSNKLKKQGEKAATIYATAGEKSKPKA